MLAENLLSLKRGLLSNVTVLLQHIQKASREKLKLNMETFWMVEVWTDLINSLMAKEGRASYLKLIKKFGVVKDIDGSDALAVKEVLSTVLSPPIDSLRQGLEDLIDDNVAVIMKDLANDTGTSLGILINNFSQVVVDMTQADFVEKKKGLQEEHNIRLDQARAQQRAAEQRIRNLVQTSTIATPEQCSIESLSLPIGITAATLRDKGYANKIAQLNAKIRDLVSQNEELVKQIDGLGVKLIEQERLSTQAISQMKKNHEEESVVLQASYTSKYMALRKEFDEILYKLRVTTTKKEQTEDVAHHLDVLCEKLNLEVNWLLKIVRRAGIAQKKVEILESEIQNRHFTGACTRQLAVSGGWKEGEAPDTSQPILQRGATNSVRSAPANVQPYPVLVEQIEVLRQGLVNEDLHDKIDELTKLNDEKDKVVSNLTATLKRRDHDNSVYLRELHNKYSKQMAEATSRTFELQKKFFVESNKIASNRQLKFSTHALDQIAKKMSRTQQNLNDAKLEIWKQKKTICELESKLAATTKHRDALERKLHGTTSDVVEVSELGSECNTLHGAEQGKDIEDNTSQDGSADEDSVTIDTPDLMFPAEGSEESYVLYEAGGKTVTCDRKDLLTPEPSRHTNSPAPPMALSEIDYQLWLEADKEVQTIAKQQLQAAQSSQRTATPTNCRSPIFLHVKSKQKEHRTPAFTERILRTHVDYRKTPVTTPTMRQTPTPPPVPVPKPPPKKVTVRLPLDLKNDKAKGSMGTWQAALQTILMDVRVMSNGNRQKRWQGSSQIDTMCVSNEQLLFNKFQEAVRDGTRDDTMEVLRAEGFPYEFVSPTGRRPIHLVCERGHLEGLEYLCTKGCSVFCLDKKKGSSMHYAAKAGSLPCVSFLLERGMPATGLADGMGDGHETAFHWAVWYAKLDVARALKNKDHSVVDMIDTDGDTVLHWACNNARVSIARKLVTEFGCDRNKSNSVGSTPMHCCAAQGDSDLSRIMTEELGADINTQDVHGDTPLHVAVSFEHLKIVELLLSHKADVYIRNTSQQTPLELAEYLSISGGIVSLLDGAVNGTFEDAYEQYKKDRRAAETLSNAVEATRLAGGH